MSRNKMLSFIIVVAMLLIAGCKTNDNVKEPIETKPVENNMSQLPTLKPIPLKPIIIPIPTPPIKAPEAKKVNYIPETKQDEYQDYELTMYTSDYRSTGKRPGDKEYGITASGKKVKTNETIACSRSLEFGTRIYIPYFDNTFTCSDRGGAITEGHLDIYVTSEKTAFDFGRRVMKVKILKEVKS